MGDMPREFGDEAFNLALKYEAFIVSHKRRVGSSRNHLRQQTLTDIGTGLEVEDDPLSPLDLDNRLAKIEEKMNVKICLYCKKPGHFKRDCYSFRRKYGSEAGEQAQTDQGRQHCQTKTYNQRSSGGQGQGQVEVKVIILTSKGWNLGACFNPRRKCG